MPRYVGVCIVAISLRNEKRAYPQEFRDLLSQLGVDPNKEGEVYELGINDSMCEYGGWFYFTGMLVEAGERLTKIGDDFTYYFSESFPKSEIDFGDDVAAVEFYTKVPWVLSDRP